MESFKPIPGHPGYEVSDHGTVRSVTRTQTLRGKGGSIYTRTLQGRILKPGRLEAGYLKVQLGRTAQSLVHQLVMLAFVGPVPDGMEVNHRNGVKSDNRLGNLEYCTPKENNEHAFYVLGRAELPPGTYKLSIEQVVEINARLQQGETATQLAAAFGVSKRMVGLIRMGKSRKKVTGNDAPALWKQKLTLEDRAKIKALLSEGRTGREVAKMFGVTPCTVSCIKNGRRSYGVTD